MRIAFGVHARRQIFLSDVREIVIRSRRLEASRRWITRLWHIYKLTGLMVSFGMPWRIFYFEKLLKALEMLNNQEDQELSVEPDEAIDITCRMVGAMIGQTPFNIENSLSPGDVVPFIEEIRRMQAEKSFSMIRAYHTPTEFANELRETVRQIGNTLKSSVKKISDKVDSLEEAIVSDRMLSAFMEPC